MLRKELADARRYLDLAFLVMDRVRQHQMMNQQHLP
jgi:hypothetical protein